MYAHEKCVMNGSRREHNPFLFGRIKDILLSGNNVSCVKIKENQTEHDALLLESSEIQKYGRRNIGTGELCNLTDGGGGMSGYKHKESTKIFMRQLHSGEKNPFYGHKHTNLSMRKIVSAAIGNTYARGMKHSPDVLSMLAALNRGKKASEETKRKMSLARKGKHTKIPVFQYDLNNTLLRQWRSASEASRCLGIGKSGISDCLRRTMKTYKSYIWRYV